MILNGIGELLDRASMDEVMGCSGYKDTEIVAARLIVWPVVALLGASAIVLAALALIALGSLIVQNPLVALPVIVCLFTSFALYWTIRLGR